MAKKSASRCEGLMKTDVKCVSAKDAAGDAARIMRDENLGFLPVCDDDQKVLGTLTDRDLTIRLVAGGKSASTPVEEVMTREVVACRPSDSLSQAEELMESNQKSRIMCVDDDGRLQGVISLSDLAQYEDGGKAWATLRKVSAREAGQMLM